MGQFIFFSYKVLLLTEGRGLSPSWSPGHYSALLLGMGLCPYSFPDEFEGLLVLGDLELCPGMRLTQGEAAHLSDHVPHNLGMLGEASAVMAVPQLAHVLGHLMSRVVDHSHGVMQSHGCCSSMADTEKRFIHFLHQQIAQYPVLCLASIKNH